VPVRPGTDTVNADEAADVTSDDVPPDIRRALAAEQDHLATARAHLTRMREQTLALDAQGGDAVSAAYLAANLHYRALSLIDDGATPLFFGRLDTATQERWYVGRRHISDTAGDPVVVDWRADVSRPFYRATRTAPMGVTLRRRFGFDRGQLTAYEDEHLTDATETDRRSAILAAEIERPRTGPMRDIVATIQPEQDEVVRADVSVSVCVQGAPGTGKTAVGLHRAAYLLYAHRDRLRRTGVLVVGPNRSFLSYVGKVLPALGEVEARHTTLEGLVGHVPVRGSDTTEVARLKGDARMAEVLHRAVWSQLREPVEELVLPRGSRRWRVATYDVVDILAELRTRGVRYAAGRALLPQRLASAVLVAMERAGESPDDRLQDAVARSRPVRSMVDAVWPALDPARVVLRLLTDTGHLAEVAGGVLSDEEQATLLWRTAPRAPGSARWSLADAVLIDEVRDLLYRTPSLGHVVLDEAQDLSPMQLRAVGRRCTTGSVTVLGDLAQGTTPWASASWGESLGHLGKEGARLEVLDRGYRVPGQVIDYTARLLPQIAPGLSAPVAVREDPGSLVLLSVSDLGDGVAQAVLAALAAEGSIGVISADPHAGTLAARLAAAGVHAGVLGSDGPEQRVMVVPATLAKGLEYDRVVVVEPADIVGGEPDRRLGLRRLYVVLTRAVSGLAVVHARPLPAELAGSVTHRL
jgi:DNA helicase IV